MINKKTLSDLVYNKKRILSANPFKTRHIFPSYKRSQSKTISQLSHKNKPEKYPIINKQKINEPESVLNMLFRYVNEEDFKIEPFKTGSDIRAENLKKNNIQIVRLNQERTIRSNFNRKFKKYDKELNTYADNPSIRCSSAYDTEDQIRRREFIESKKYWLSKEDFKRVFGKNTENDRIKKLNERQHMIIDKYSEPYKRFEFRKADKTKWVCKKRLYCLIFIFDYLFNSL